MKRDCSLARNLHMDIFFDLTKRMNHQTQLSEVESRVDKILNDFASLRVGPSKNRVSAKSREIVQGGDINSILRVVSGTKV
jgi:hypothetical protein